MRNNKATKDQVPGLSDQMRERSRSLHHQAETTGIVYRMLKGQCTLQAYALYLRNLALIYQTLELGFSRPAVKELTGLTIDEGVFRSEPIDRDLRSMAGRDWERTIPILQSTREYRQHLQSLFEAGESDVVVHAYVRYLGDLNGGQVLAKLLRNSAALQPDQLAFYRFEKLPDLKISRQRLRESIDQSVPGARAPGSQAMETTLAEVECAFRHNIAVSIEVEHYAADQGLLSG